MREFKTNLLIPLPIDHAFELVFNSTQVSQIMKEKNEHECGPWEKNKRKIHFEMQNENIPGPLLQILGGGKIRVTATQIKKEERDKGKIVVVNKIRPHLLGAEFIKIRPTMTLTETTGGTLFDIRCEMHAVFPPPLNSMLEEFMLMAIKFNYEWFIQSLGQLHAPQSDA